MIALYVSGGVIVLFVIIGFFLPRKIHVARSVIINGTKEEIFPHLNDLKSFVIWSPWGEKDPNIEQESSDDVTDVVDQDPNRWLNNEHPALGPDLRRQVREAQLQDPFIRTIADFIATENETEPFGIYASWFVTNRMNIFMDPDTGILYWINPNDQKRCLIVPEDSKHDLLVAAHDKFGHVGPPRVQRRLKSWFWWKGMHADVQKHIRACVHCATLTGKMLKTKPPMTPIPIVNKPFHQVAMDIVKLGKSTDGYHCALVITDLFTKWPEV